MSETYRFYDAEITQSCCFCIKSFLGSSFSEAKLDYEKNSKFTAQDCILPVKNRLINFKTKILNLDFFNLSSFSFLDAIVYRQGFNNFHVSLDSSNAYAGASENICMDCMNLGCYETCGKYWFKCLSKWKVIFKKCYNFSV